MICVIILFHMLVAAAEETSSSQLLVKQLTLEEGLPNNKVNAIAKDKHGFMWFGTNDGLCRFDGFQIQIYPLDNYLGSDTRTSQIGALKTDNSGNLLIGSYTLFKYNYDTDQIEECKIESPIESIQSIGRVHALEVTVDGLIYVGAENGLFSYNSTTKQVQLLSKELSDEKQSISLLSDSEQLWVGTENSALYRYQYLDATLHAVKAYNLPPIEKNQILCFYKYETGLLWMGTLDNGLLQLNLNDSILSKITIDADLRITNRIRKIIHNSDNNIWIATREGLYLYNNGIFTRKAYQENPVSSLSANSIYDILIDDHSTMWLGTFNGGVNYIHLNRKPFILEKSEESLSNIGKGNINGFVEDQELNLWIASGDYGLFFKDKATGKIEKYASNLLGNQNILNNIKAIAIDSSGCLWAGTYDGLFYINRKKQQLINYNTKNSKICSNQIRSIQIDAAQNVWIATNDGVSYYDNMTQSFQTYLSGLEIHPLYIDQDQNIWVGASSAGIFKYNPKQKEFEVLYTNYFSSFIRCMMIDSNKNLWIGNNKGLYFVNRATDQLLSYGLKDGLPTLRINGFLEDESKNLWVSTGAGLLKCNRLIDQPENFSFNTFSSNDGLQGRQFRLDAFYKSRTGEMYFGGDLGYNKFYPSAIKDDVNTPKTALTDLKIYNKKVQIGQKLDGQIILPKAINELTSIDLSYKHRLFTIEFAALHYSNPMGNQYRYRLLPFQNEWVYSSGLRNFANYSNLKGGDYIFQLEVANSDKVWNPETRILKIKVHPPFWATLWFMICSLTFVFGLLISAYMLRVTSLKKRNVQLENKVRERTLELKESIDQLLSKQALIEEQTMTLNTQKEKLLELNSTKDKFFTIIAHDLKNPFQSILGMSELLYKQLEKSKTKEIRLFVQEIFNATNNIYSLLENLLTWARTQTERIEFTPVKLNVPSLISSTVQLLEKNILDKQLIVHFEIETYTEGIADRNMIETVIRNLLTNAIKYTPIGGTINIQLKSVDDFIEFSISDNGIGISEVELGKLFIIAENKSQYGTEGEKGTGLGLLICKEFILKNKGKIWAKSILHQGSTFYFTIPSINQSALEE